MHSFRYCFVADTGYLHEVQDFASGSDAQAIAVARVAFAACPYPILEVWHAGRMIFKETRADEAERIAREAAG